MTVTFTLTGPSTLTAAGPFNISGTTGSNVTSQLATGITKDQLLTGHTITNVNDSITGGTIASTGTCSTTTTWSSTPTPTPTMPVITPQYSFDVYVGTVGDANTNGSACYNFVLGSSPITIYSNTDTSLVSGNQYLTSNGSIYNGRAFVYSDGTKYGKIFSSGYFTYLDDCTPSQPPI